MLQPPQLQDVSSRYTEEIAELRSFLRKAGVLVGTSQALGSVAVRVQNDKGFHRDLAANLWVTTEGEDRQIGFADLLGLLAIAAAGIEFASDADEQDTLALLRFLKEIRPSRDTYREVELNLNSAEIANLHQASIPTQTVEHVSDKIDALNPATAGVREPQICWNRQGEQAEPTHKQSQWLIAGMCSLLVVVLIAWFFRSASRPKPVAPQAGAVGNSEGALPGGKNDVATASGEDSFDREPPPSRPKVFRSEDGDTSWPKPKQPIGPAPSRANTQTTLLTSPASEVPPSAPKAALANNASLPSSAVTSSATALDSGRTTARPMSAAPVPASILSKRLGSPTLPPYASSQGGDAAVEAQRRPRLLRRHPAAGGDDYFVAALQPNDKPAQLQGRQPTSSTAQFIGSVRPTALGMMAANVVYSPVPPYPVAASAAHVTGEVKLTAEVDRDGNVTYARVVSGPPLLRDAALNALQQWRYRPYVSRGKAVPMTAMAVMDFQMP